MKDQSTKVLEDDPKLDSTEVKPEKVNNIVEKDKNIPVPAEEPVEKNIVDDLINDVKELNIKPDDDTGDGDEGELVERGPHGGIGVPHYTDKNIPINHVGQYMPNSGYGPIQQDNGRRNFDQDLQDPTTPCRKFRRPAPQPTQMPMYQPERMGGFQFNNLNAPTETNPFNNPDSSQMVTYSPLTNSGGKVTVKSPPPNPKSSIADDFLDAMTTNSQMPQMMVKQQHAGQFPPGSDLNHWYQMPPMTTREENVLSPTPSVCSVNMMSPINGRRPSDPQSDSGVESAEEKSPYSDVAPSPTGSNYSCPPSVESGYGRSPQHEPMFGQNNHTMSSPQYPGIMSPGSNRVTPSPASSTEYYSPMHPTQTDEFFANPEIEYSLQLALDVIDKDLKESQIKKQHVKHVVPGYPNMPMCPVPGNQIPQSVNFLANPQMSKQPINFQQPGIPVQMVQPNPPIPNILPTAVTTSSAPPSIIIVQNSQPVPNTNAPVILFAQVPKTQPEKKKPRKILPKSVSSTLSTTTTSVTNAGVVTTTSPSNRSTNIMAHREGGPAINRNGQQASMAQAAQQNRLLMIARRTVADMTSDELKKSDDEGDTYLHIAVCKTDKYMVQALLERLRREGLDNLVDQDNNKRQTPLYLAVYINQPVMVAMFIKFQANVNVLAQSLSSDGLTREVKAAIHVAASQGHEYIDTLQQLLLAKDISINIVNNYGQTALHCAIAAHNRVKRNSEDRINSVSIIKMLIKAGADVSAQDQKSGKTPLMYAIEQRDLTLVQTILSCIEPSKMRNVVRTQAFDGSSCLKIAEGLKDSYNIQAWNRLWDSLQSAASGSVRIQPPVF